MYYYKIIQPYGRPYILTYTDKITQEELLSFLNESEGIAEDEKCFEHTLHDVIGIMIRRFGFKLYDTNIKFEQIVEYD